MASRRTAGRVRSAIVAVVVLALVATASEPAGASGPSALEVSASGVGGTGRIARPGRTCAEGGDGASWHYAYRAPLSPKVFSSLPGDLRLNLDVHSEGSRSPEASHRSAFLLPQESAATLVNDRGTLRLALAAGAGCRAQGGPADAPLAFDGTVVSGGGTWSVAGGTGSYREAKGSGQFVLPRAEVAPGADNRFDISLRGSVEVLQPRLSVNQVASYWGFLGADYLLRRVTVVYRVANGDTDPATPEGDAFAVGLAAVTTGDPNIKVLGPTVQRLGDLAPGQSQDIWVRYEIGSNIAHPCGLVVLGCAFTPTLRLERLDALDVAAENPHAAPSRAPLFPPPL